MDPFSPAEVEYGETVPEEIECPTNFEKHKQACYQFSDHSDYERAKQSCEAVGARLADIEPTHGKFVIDKVRSMGGNDFWIGSFLNSGRVFRQASRNSCPVMRGQIGSDKLYGLVNCNSANRFVCQKYGPDNKANRFNSRPKVPPSDAAPTMTTSSAEDNVGGTSPVIYVVVTVIILIAAMIALKLVSRRYFRDKKKKKSQRTKDTKNAKADATKGKGTVFTPSRKTGGSKATSLDSAV